MTDIAEAIDALHRAGWSIGDTAFARDQGGRVWVISGHNGESLIQAEGRTRDEASVAAGAQAVGMCRK